MVGLEARTRLHDDSVTRDLLDAAGRHGATLFDYPAAHERQGQGYQESPEGAEGHSELLYTSVGSTDVEGISLPLGPPQELSNSKL
jgi:hypothetical protein